LKGLPSWSFGTTAFLTAILALAVSYKTPCEEMREVLTPIVLLVFGIVWLTDEAIKRYQLETEERKAK
jgi:NhaP-type Na+/H+ or K+/H+ antiporter